MLTENIIILKKLYKRKKHILLVTLLSLAITFVLVRFVQPAYKSIAYVYPSNLGLYSEESQTEQLLQFAVSNEIRLYLFQKYKLAKHYKIDTLKKTYPFIYDEIYDKKISINKTKYESVEIKVEDFNPDTARMLVNGIIEGINLLIEKEHKAQYTEDVANSKIFLDLKQHEIDSAQVILNELSEKYGVLDMRIQLKEAAKTYYKNMGGAKSSPLGELLSNLGKHGVEYVKLNAFFDHEVRAYAAALDDYHKHLTDYKRKNSFVVVASKPTRPVIASWPKRTLILLVVGVSVFVLACAYFIFIDRIKQTYEQIASEE